MTLAITPEEQRIIRLHEAQTGREMAMATFELVNNEVPSFAQFITLRPMEFELPSFSSDPKFQRYFDQYISSGHKTDIWLRRGPINPTVRVLRHSDHTPLHILKRSVFYKKVMALGGCDHGASMVAWRGDNWLSTLTLFRTPDQGDFTESEMALLARLQRHFESAVKRVAEIYEAKQGTNSLEVFIWSLPTAAIVLSWDLTVLHHNAAAQDAAALWRHGGKAKALKTVKSFQVPGIILEKIREQIDRIPDVAPTRYNRPKISPMLTVEHPTIPGLRAKVSFLPSRSLALSRGTFLVSLEGQERGEDKAGTFDLMNKLSRRERRIVALAIEGKNSVEIGKELSTLGGTVRVQLHNIYRKLNIKSRYELMSLVMKSTGKKEPMS